MERKPYPTDVSDAEWALEAPYLNLMTEDAPQRDHFLREVFNGLQWIVRAGSSWRMMSHDLPPWEVDYQLIRAMDHSAWLVTMNDCLKSWPGCISWHSSY